MNVATEAIDDCNGGLPISRSAEHRRKTFPKADGVIMLSRNLFNFFY